MFKKWTKATKMVNCEWEEEHVAGKEVPNNSVTGDNDGGGRITFVDTTKFPFFICLKM